VTESFRTQDGRTLTYRRGGAGPVLVCHPGGPGFSSLYLSDLAGLGDTFTLILLNPRGTARSSAPADARAYTTADYVADVEELRLHLGVDELNVLGHSHGGVVAMAYAAQHPTNVRRLVAADTLARLHPGEMDEIMLRHRDEPWYDDARLALEQEDAGDYANEAELREITRRFLPIYFAHFDEGAEAYLDECVTPERPNPDALKLFNEGIAEWDMRPELAGVDAPTLVITGTEDFICGPACAADIEAGISGSKKVLIEDCGHFSFVEEPQRFHEEIKRFLA
jgi:proline-specific peptidase